MYKDDPVLEDLDKGKADKMEKSGSALAGPLFIREFICYRLHTA
jgi:hypothetical protein